MSGRLDGKVALVTGGGMGGIGAAVAALFRAEAAWVFTADIVSGQEADALGCDVADRAQVEATIASVVLRAGRLDILVHAAALLGGTGTFLDVSAEDFRRYVAVNLEGTFHVCQECARAMVRGGGGAIVTVGSVNSFAAEPLAAAYVASKHAVLGLTRAMAVDLAAENIRVNMVAPGPIEVPRNAELFAGAPLREMFDRCVPLRRPGLGDDIARAALFLAEDAQRYITGSVVTVDGGTLAQIMRAGE